MLKYNLAYFYIWIKTLKFIFFYSKNSLFLNPITIHALFSLINNQVPRYIQKQ